MTPMVMQSREYQSLHTPTANQRRRK